MPIYIVVRILHLTVLTFGPHSQVELRPERGFVNMVPFGFMMIRHFFRKVRAKGNYELFKATGIFDEKEVRAGTKRVFEVISQHAYKVRDLPLVDSGGKVEYVPIPPDYGYAAPRLIFAFTTFGNRILGKGEVDPDVQLLDFQYLVI
ncbi:hypothetical protein ANCCEY_00592 [Ancylostoma ceylanicum]|uniref:Uncharacterized protein n=1 Tax=Ancylostoma ceylanicum TaxID=53326 RepID=A0A0D6M8B3_9BILA|nr:hypothetical protein ANCCEY_00592 [Ancylostoma ceylanicum]